MTKQVPIDLSADLAIVMDGLRPDRVPPTLREFIGRMRYPGGPLGPKGGKPGHYIDIDSDPLHAYIVDQIDSGKWESLALCASPQVSGKTLIAILGVSLHSIIGLRLPTGYALPTLSDLDKAWTTKLKVQIESSGMAKALPATGPGARGGRGPAVTLRDPETLERAAQMIFAAGGAYADTFARLCIDEADQFRKADGTPDWKAIDDLRARTGSYGRNAFTTIVGTLETNLRENSIILSLCDEEGTGTRPWLQCPECGQHQLVNGKALVYNPTDMISVRETVRIQCMHCPALWDQTALYQAQRKMLFVHRGQTIEDGVVVGPTPNTVKLGIVANAYSASIVDLGRVAVERWESHRKAERGDFERIQKHYWYAECEPYTGRTDEAAEALSLQVLTDRSAMGWAPAVADSDRSESGEVRESYSRHIATWPDGAQWGVVVVDVQHNRMYWEVIGGDSLDRSYDIAWGYEFADGNHGPMTGPQVREVLHRIAGLSRMIGERRILGGFVDIGDGNLADDILDALHELPGWYACDGKGDSIRPGLNKDPRDIPGTAYLRCPDQWKLGKNRPLVHICSQTVRAMVQGAYMLPVGRPGAAHLPQSLDGRTAYLRHLLSEELHITPRGQRVWKKKAGGGRNDWLDARVYARAALALLKPSAAKPQGKAKPKPQGKAQSYAQRAIQQSRRG